MTRISLSLSIPLLLGCTSSLNFDATEHAASLSDARLRMEVGEVDEALVITDRLLGEDPNNRGARLLAAEGSLLLSEHGRSNTQDLIADGIRNYELALELDNRDPVSWVALSRAYLKNAQFIEGRDAALQAANLLGDDAGGAAIAEAVLAAADNEMQIFKAQRQAEFESPGELDPNGLARPSADTLALASAVFARLNYAKQAAPGRAFSTSAVVYQWLGQYSNALSELERGLDAAPGEEELHVAYEALHFQMGRRQELVAAYRRLARERAGISIVQWFLGRAQAFLGDLYRRQGDWEQAAKAYEEARRTFVGYRVIEPRNAGSTDHWLAICNLSLGRMAYESGNLDLAVEHYTAAFENTPAVAELDENGTPIIYDNLGGNYAGGLDMVGRALGNGNGPEALAERLAHYEWIIQRHPDTFSGIYNNAGFIARDLGVAIEARGARRGSTEAEQTAATTRAMELWERGYAYYEKAVALAPEDPRIVNDCGVMLVYHLKRGYDRALELFDLAIEVGQPMIDALDGDSSQEERELLEEAVGDAHQNIAVAMRDLGRPFADYRASLETAVAFFPYQRRDAVSMLQNDGRPGRGRRGSAAATGARGSNPSQDPQDPRKAAFDRVIREASPKADSGDVDGALLVLDAVFSEMNGYPPFHYYLGLYSFRYATQARDLGGSLGQVQGLYEDATRHLQRSVDLDGEPTEPRLALAEVHYETGDFAGAAREAGDLLAALQANGVEDPETVRACQSLRAQACARVYIAVKQGGGDDTENLGEARRAFRSLEAATALDQAMVQSWSLMEQWANAHAEALAVVGRATERFPESEVLHRQLMDLASQPGLAGKAVGFLENRRDPLGLWFLGRARFALADEQWMGSELDEAIEQLDRAFENFGESMTRNEAYRDSSEQWAAMCLGKKGMVLVSMGRIDDAERALLNAARMRPDRIDASLGGNNSVKRGLMVIGDRYFQADDLANAQRIFGEASKAAPADIDFANNYGLFARDYGERLERRDEDKEAQRLFEASYEAYTLASQLDPENVRLLNDRALMLVHHLKRDWEIAEQCLQKGIALGEKQLENPPEDAGDRQVLDEAIGDCYENLGLYHLEHTEDLDKAEANYKKALTFYPTDSRFGTRRGLRRVEERRKDGVERDRL